VIPDAGRARRHEGARAVARAQHAEQVSARLPPLQEKKKKNFLPVKQDE
jgi:hypothetical protein